MTLFQVAQSIIKNGNEGMGKKMKDLDLGELCFCRFLLFNSPCVLKGTGWDNEIRLALKVRAVGTEDIFTSNYQSYFEELKEITFSETGESVLFSKEFDKFLSKRKREIAKLLGVKVHEVSGTISEEMDFPDLGHLSISQIVRYVSEFVALENNGSEFWVNYYSCHYEDIDDYYIPDTDSIIRNYYMVRVMEMYYRYKDNWDDFTKGDLFKGWEINPARDLQGICYMYCIDTIYKMFSKMMKEYYRIFPWNKFGFMNAKTQYEQMENDLNKIIEEQKKEIDSLNKQISSLKE